MIEVIRFPSDLASAIDDPMEGTRAAARTPLESIDPRILPVLAKCFSGPVLREIHDRRMSAYMAAAFDEAKLSAVLGNATTLLTAAAAIFSCMRKRYRSDYVYRAAIFEKLFLGRHSPATTTALSELRVGQCRADVVMLNGTSTVYEIKSELDSLCRLETQLATYLRMFDCINVVTHGGEVDRLLRTVPENVGVIELTRAFSLRMARRPRSNAAAVDVATVIDALRSSEVAELTRRLCGTVPKVGNVRLVAACAEMLSGHDPIRVHHAMVTILKKRRSYGRQHFSGVPVALLPAYMECGLKPTQWVTITEALTTTTIGDVLGGKTWPPTTHT